MKLLYLHLSTLEGPAHAWRADTEALADLGTGELATLAQQNAGSPCIVFLPTSLCLMVSAPVNARQLRQAGTSLAWLVEDQTGEEAEGLHVVAGPSEGDVTPLLAVSRAILRQGLQRLREAGLHPLAVIPDLFLVPRDDSDWQLQVQGNHVVLRTGPFSGAALEVDLAETMLDAALLERGSAPTPSLSVAGGASDVTARVERWAQGHADMRHRLVDTLTASVALTAEPDWSRHPANLLQGEFAEHARLALPPALKWAALFLVAAFGLQLLSELLHMGIYRVQADRVGTQVVSRYHSLFPEERLSAQPAMALQDVQKRLRGKRNEGQAGSNVLPTVTRVAQALQGSGLSAQRIDILGSVLTLDVDARSLGELDSFKQKLDGAGLSTEIVSANNQGGSIRGRLKVEGGA